MFDEQGAERRLNLPLFGENIVKILHPGVYVKAEASNVVIVDPKDVPPEVKRNLLND